ncbi:MAG: hypothetical protein EXR76_00885 [Myxococcales bacterium]|nr:hypothetical protein [Myxococcales bacterium]
MVNDLDGMTGMDDGGPRPDRGVCIPGAALSCEGPNHRWVCTRDGGARLEACAAGRTCLDGLCDTRSCAGDRDCSGDFYCHESACIDYGRPPRDGANGGCRLAPEIFDFSPEIQCHWAGGEISGQPIALDLDGDEIPEIVVVTAGSLVAIRGDDCTELMRSNTGLLSNESCPAAGDLDGDGRPEVVAVGGFGLVFAFDQNFELKWSAPVAAGGLGSAPAIADLDADGQPEVIAGTTAINGEDGTLHGEAAPILHHGFGPIPVVADLDGDGRQEVVYGNRIFDSQMTDITPPAMRALSAGHVAVADFDPTFPGPELAVVFGQARVRVQRPDGTVIFGPYDTPDSMWAGGAPNVADFDGDGLPEIGTAGSHFYAVFDLQCVGEPLPVGCESPGVRWTKAVRDTSSGSTGSTTFDFEGDGRVEVVYNDECFLRVYDGDTGAVRLAVANTTGTLIEAPIVLDVDGDYNSEIVLGSDRGFPCADPDPDTGTPARQTFGITVVKDVTDRWVHSRPIWNQNAYSITNVNQDGTIPPRPEVNWERFNSFRENAQPDDKALEAPDLTVRADGPMERLACEAVDLSVQVFNRGTQPVPRGLTVTFFDGSPSAGGVVICETETSERLESGEGERVGCRWEAPPDDADVVYAFVDADFGNGGSSNRNAECVEANNFATFGVSACLRP